MVPGAVELHANASWYVAILAAMTRIKAGGDTVSDAIKFLEPRQAVLSRRATIIADLADLLPPECLVHEPRELVPFETDAFVSYRRLPLAVALPRTTEQVAAVMKYCHRYGVPVVPRGAGTSLSGALSRRKMRSYSGFPRCRGSSRSIPPIARQPSRRA